jgi:hypothetical protein
VCMAAQDAAEDMPRSHHASARIGRFVYSLGGKAWTPGYDGTETAQLTASSSMFQVLDTDTGSIQSLESASSECAWPAPRASTTVVAWRERFLVMFGGLVRLRLV